MEFIYDIVSDSQSYKGKYPKFPKNGAQIQEYEITGVLVQSEQELKDGTIIPEGIIASRRLSFKGKLFFQAYSRCYYRINFMYFDWSEKYNDYDRADIVFLCSGLVFPEKRDIIIPFDFSYTFEDYGWDYFQIGVEIDFRGSHSEKQDMYFTACFKVPDEYK
jgi:hypothetical protein